MTDSRMNDLGISDIENSVLMDIDRSPMTFQDIESKYGLPSGMGLEIALRLATRQGVALDIEGEPGRRRIGILHTGGGA